MPGLAGPAQLVWLVVAMGCQFLWGLYPVGIRYMQTKSEHPLTSLQLSFLINLLACPALFFGTTLPFWLSRTWRRSRNATAVTFDQPVGCADSPAGLGNGKVANGSPAGSAPLPPGSAWDSALAEPLLAADDLRDVEEQSLPFISPAPNGQLSMVLSAADEQPLEEQQARRHNRAWQAQAKVLLLTTFFLSSLFLAQVFSLLFTTAYLSQMVFLLAPVIVALAAKVLFKSPLPKGLWPALTLMLLGCGMVIGSKATGAGTHGFKHSVDYQPRFGPQQALWARVHSAESAQLCVAVFGEQRARWLCGLADEGHDEQQAPSWAGQDGSSRWQSAAADGKAFGRPLESDSLDRLAPAHSKSVVVTGKAKPKPGPRPKPKPHHRGSGMGMHDILGIALSFWGACCVAGFMTVVQRTHGTVSDQQVLWANFLTQIPFSFLLTFLFEHEKLGVLLHLGSTEVLEVFALAAGVNWFANWVQQMCIRTLGAPQAAAFLPMRLLGSLAASYPLLHESLDGPWQWGGVLLLLVAVTGYLLQQMQRKPAAVEAAALAPPPDEEVYDGPAFVA